MRLKPLEILLGTVLLDANRWKREQPPALELSAWLPRIEAAGFDGLELWERHALHVPASTLAALADSPLKVKVLNSYAAMDAAGATDREASAELARRLGVGAVKFNVGPAGSDAGVQLRIAEDWAASMPGVQLLCECHAGTALEKPETAAKALEPFPGIGVIIHPFNEEDLASWLRVLGGRIHHAHVQVVDSAWQRWRLKDRPQWSLKRFSELASIRNQLSYTIEFTKGVATPDENPDSLLRAAVEDMQWLREHLRLSADEPS